MYKRGNTYWYDFWFQGDRYNRTTEKTCPVEAKAVEDKRKAEVKAAWAADAEKRKARSLLGIDEPAPAKKTGRMTLDKACGRYMLEVARHLPSADTTEPQLANLARIIGNDVMLDEITGDNLTKFIETRRGEPSKNSPRKGPVRYLGPATVNREVEVLRRVMNRARDKWDIIIPKMPLWHEYMLPEPDGPVSVLTAEQEDSIRHFLRRDLRNFFDFSLLCAMRKMGQVNLKKSQVDFEARTIKLKVKSKKHAGGRNVVVRISKPMLAILKAEWNNHPTFVFTYIAHRTTKTRTAGQRYPLTRSGWRRLWKAATKLAGVPEHRWHDNRHTAATRLGRSSKDLGVVQKLLCHADIASTMIYKHTTEDDVLEAMEELHASRSKLRRTSPDSRPDSRKRAA